MHCGLCVWLQVAEAALLPTLSSAAFVAALVHAVATVNSSAIITAIHSCRHHSRPSPTTPWSEPAAEPQPAAVAALAAALAARSRMLHLPLTAYTVQGRISSEQNGSLTVTNPDFPCYVHGWGDAQRTCGGDGGASSSNRRRMWRLQRLGSPPTELFVDGSNRSPGNGSTVL